MCFKNFVVLLGYTGNPMVKMRSTNAVPKATWDQATLNSKKLPGGREVPIYHRSGTVTCNMVEQIKKLYPNYLTWQPQGRVHQD